MNRQALLQITLLVSTVLLCCCAAQKQREQIPPISGLKDEVKLEPAIAELKRLYRAAQTQFERREVCLRALDDGAVHRGIPVTSVDEIFSTHFATDRATRRTDGIRVGVVHFVPDVLAPLTPDGKIAASGFFGWYLAVDYDDSGTVQNYYLSNIHKGSSNGEPGKEPIPIGKLKQLYEAAESEREQREVCLRAIDEGVIQTFGPVRVSTVDAIFGTSLASNLPKRKERTGLGYIDFASDAHLRLRPHEKVEALGPKGWFMAVEYYHDGNIDNYYLATYTSEASSKSLEGN